MLGVNACTIDGPDLTARQGSHSGGLPGTPAGQRRPGRSRRGRPGSWSGHPHRRRCRRGCRAGKVMAGLCWQIVKGSVCETACPLVSWPATQHASIAYYPRQQPFVTLHHSPVGAGGGASGGGSAGRAGIGGGVGASAGRARQACREESRVGHSGSHAVAVSQVDIASHIRRHISAFMPSPSYSHRAQIVSEPTVSA